MTMITDSRFYFKAFHNQSVFKHTQNVFQDIPESPKKSKKTLLKKNLRAITVLKKEGGVRRGMIMITDSMVFFLSLPLGLCEKVIFRVLNGK